MCEQCCQNNNLPSSDGICSVCICYEKGLMPFSPSILKGGQGREPATDENACF